MNLAKWISLFLTTVGIGIVTALVVGTGVFFVNAEISVSEMGMEGVAYNLFQTVIVGSLLGAFSHMGFFAYLTVNYFAQGIFRSQKLWSYIQVLLIVAVAFYSVVLRVPQGESVLSYVMLPLSVWVAALPVTMLKVKQTNRNAWIPTFFFLTAVTLLEAVPALRQYNAYGTVMMVAPLFLCNAWQIMRLHKLVPPSAATQKKPAGNV